MDGKPRLRTTTLTTENGFLYFDNKVFIKMKIDVFTFYLMKKTQMKTKD